MTSKFLNRSHNLRLDLYWQYIEILGVEFSVSTARSTSSVICHIQAPQV